MQRFSRLFPFTVLLLAFACMHHPVIVPDGGGNGGGNNGGGGGNNGGGSVTKPCDPDSVYFSRDVLPILVSNCAMSGCHDADSHKDGVILNSYANVVSTGEVQAGNPGESDLYKVLVDTDPDDRMPPAPATALGSDQIETIRRWILQGARDLTCDAGCDTTVATYSGVVKPILDNFCVGCHSGNQPGGNIDLAAFAGVKAIADNGKLLGSIRHETGFKAMPQGGDKLDSCSIARIESWVTAGARQD